MNLADQYKEQIDVKNKQEHDARARDLDMQRRNIEEAQKKV